MKFVILKETDERGEVMVWQGRSVLDTRILKRYGRMTGFILIRRILSGNGGTGGTASRSLPVRDVSERR